MTEILGRDTHDATHDFNTPFLNNVVADRHREAPANGWLTRVYVHAGGYGGSTTARLGLWLVSEDQRLIFAGDEQTWNGQREWRSADLNAMRVSPGDTFRMGFKNDPTQPAQWSLTLGVNQYFVMTHLSDGLPDPFNGERVDGESLSCYVEFLRNEAPLKGTWRDEMPSGSTTQPDILYSGTLPHAGAGAAAVRAGRLTIDANGAAMVDVESDSEIDLVGYAREDDEGAMRGPSGVYEALNDQDSHIRAKATDRVSRQGDAEFDYSSLVEVRVTRVSDGVEVYREMFEPTDIENAQGYFSRNLFPLTAGSTYDIDYRHADSWGEWAHWSDKNRIAVAEGPLAPVLNAPAGKIALPTGIVFNATHGHVGGLNANGIRVQIYNGSGSTKLYDQTFTLSPTVAVGAAMIVNQWFPALTPGRGYRVRLQARDTLNRWGEWTKKLPFRINTAPNVPSKMSPAGSIRTSNANLKVRLSDPDGDPITQAFAEVYSVNPLTRVATKLPGYPKEMQVSIDGGAASLNVANDLTPGTLYQWRAYAHDGLAASSWTGYAQFTYIVLPVVTLRSPREGGIANLVKQPSAEYDPAAVGLDWQEVGRVEGTRTVTRVTDGDARWGVASWEAITDGNAGHYWETLSFTTVDAAKHYVLIGFFKNKSGSPATRFALACYDSSNVFIGLVVPSTNGALDGAPAANVWSDYGGSIWPITQSTESRRFPTGTAKVRVRWYPSVNAGASGTVRLDSVFLAQAESKDESEWQKVAAFWAYMDANHEWFGAVDDRTWDAVAGNSISRGPNVLSAPSAWVEIGYVSPVSQNSPKVSDRVQVDRWQTVAERVSTSVGTYKRLSGRWKTVHTASAGSTGSPQARTTIPIPTNVVQNEARYRVKVWAKDALGNEGESDWAEFDTIYEGPSELDWIMAVGDTERGELVGWHYPSTFDPNQIKQLEYRVTPDGGEPVIYVQQDATAERFVYPYPVSGVGYTIEVRQIQIVGREEVESAWKSIKVSVDYFPKHFIKHVRDPERLAVGFWVPGGTLPTISPVIPTAAPITWGSKKPKPQSGIHEYVDGTISALLWSDPVMSDDEKRAVMFEMVDLKGTMCLMSHRPGEKRFIALKENGAPMKLTSDYEYQFDLSYNDVEWDEDYLAREGRVDVR